MDQPNQAKDTPTNRQGCVLFCRASSETAARRQMGRLYDYAGFGGRNIKAEFLILGSARSRKAQNAIDNVIIFKRRFNDFDELVVTDFSRLTREGTEAMLLMAVFAKAGIRLVTLDLPIVTADPCPHLELDLASDSPRALKESDDTLS